MVKRQYLNYVLFDVRFRLQPGVGLGIFSDFSSSCVSPISIVFHK
jgi:hypothetical protein